MKYYNKIVNCKKEIKETRFNNGSYYYTIDFIYDVQYIIFGKIFTKHYIKTDCIKFADIEKAKRYLSFVEKESSLEFIFIGRYSDSGTQVIEVFPKDMDKIKKYYNTHEGIFGQDGVDPHIIYTDNKFNLISGRLYSADDVDLGNLIKRLIDQKENVVTTVEVIKDQYISLPSDDQLKKLQSERNEVIEYELQRVEKYKSFLQTLIKYKI